MINVLVICDGVHPFYVTANRFVSEIIYNKSKGRVNKLPVHILFGSADNGEPAVLLIAGEKFTSFSDAIKLRESVNQDSPNRHYHIDSARRSKKKR